MSRKTQPPDDFANRFDAAFADLQLALADPCGRRAEWPARVAAAIVAALEFAAADPVAARVLTVDALAQGDYGIYRHQRLIDHCAELLGAGAPEDPRRPQATELGVVGGIVYLVTRRLLQGKEASLGLLAPDLIQFALIPYLGLEGATSWARRHRP